MRPETKSFIESHIIKKYGRRYTFRSPVIVVTLTNGQHMVSDTDGHGQDWPPVLLSAIGLGVSESGGQVSSVCLIFNMDTFEGTKLMYVNVERSGDADNFVAIIEDSKVIGFQRVDDMPGGLVDLIYRFWLKIINARK